MTSNPVTAWINGVFAASRDALRATAERVRADVRPRIQSGRAPSGGPQRPNTSRTSAVKARRYGHATPLLADGVLSDPDRYRVVGGADGWTYIIHPPQERAQVIGYLRDRGYEVFEVPAEAVKWLAEELRGRLPKR